MVKKIVLFLFAGFGVLFANEHGGSDIVERSINFIIFIAVMYYLLATKIKDFFQERQNQIASELSSVDNKIKISKKELDDAKQEVEKAKEVAASIEKTNQDEIKLLLEKLEEQGKFELELLDKQKEEKKEVARNHMIREVITESLDEIIDVNSVIENKEELIKSLLKRVA